MSVVTFNGACKTAVTLLALCHNRFVTGMRTSLTEHENLMMENGTFVYSSLSSEEQALLFKDFEILFSREVKHRTYFADICVK